MTIFGTLGPSGTSGMRCATDGSLTCKRRKTCYNTTTLHEYFWYFSPNYFR